MSDKPLVRNTAMRAQIRKVVASMPETFLQRHAQTESAIHEALVRDELRAMEKEGLIKRMPLDRAASSLVRWQKTATMISSPTLMDRLRTVKTAAEWQREYLEVAA